MSKAKSGALVQYCGHNAMFIADIYEINGVNVVRANGPVDKHLIRPAKEPTHHMVDFPRAGFWKPDLGVFVVPSKQVREL